MTLQLDMDFETTGAHKEAFRRTLMYPRLRFMGSKYRVIPQIAQIFSEIPFETALDGFCGSGVVSYLLKELGKEVISNDFLHFPATIATALVENPGVRLDAEDIERVLSPNRDSRDFILRTFQGLYFPDDDHRFLDAAWSHIEGLPRYKRELALSALCLAAARKQPRGVFTISDFRYDDGRRSLRMPLRDLFQEALADYNRAVFDNGRKNSVTCQDIFEVDPIGIDLVYLDPPYAPPKDDADYMKRYHFLEGLSVYWQDQKIMENTITKKIEKRFTPFAYKRTIRDAFRELFNRFRNSTIVLSYGSNSIPNDKELMELLAAEKKQVEMFTIPHCYSFGTHGTALRRNVDEYVFVAR